MQKRTACIRTTGTLTMFNELNWILFFIETYTCMKIYMRLDGTSLDCIKSILKTNSQIHNRSTRFLNLNLHCPVYYKNTAGHTFSMSTIIRNWNELSTDVKKV